MPDTRIFIHFWRSGGWDASHPMVPWPTTEEEAIRLFGRVNAIPPVVAAALVTPEAPAIVFISGPKLPDGWRAGYRLVHGSRSTREWGPHHPFWLNDERWEAGDLPDWGWMRELTCGDLPAEIPALRALFPPPGEPPPFPDALDDMRDRCGELGLDGTADLAARAYHILDDVLSRARRPYVAFSGGKDSHVALALARLVRPEIEFIWSDDELEFPETVALMQEMQARENQFRITLGWAEHAGWFRPWAMDLRTRLGAKEPGWFREPLPGSIRVDRDMNEWAADEGYDLCVLGLRMDESRARASHLAAAGPRYWRRTGAVACPLFDWPTEAVFHAAGALGVRLNRAYSRYEEIGIDLEHQRVGPLPLAPRATLHAGWPDLLARLDQRYPGRW